MATCVSVTVVGVANIKAESVTVDKQQANVGEIITVTAKITNYGTASGSEWFDVYVNGTAIGQPKQVTLGVGESTTLSWTLSFDKPGTYEVCVDTILYF